MTSKNGRNGHGKKKPAAKKANGNGKAGNAANNGHSTLRPQGRTGQPGHNEATQQTQKLLRQEKALELYAMQRLTMRQIATQLTAQGLPCTAKTVCLDIHAAVIASRERRDESVDHYRSVEGMRLDQLDRQLVPIAYDQLPAGSTVVVGKGKEAKTFEIPIPGPERLRLRLAAIGELRRNSESRRKLFGWDVQPSMGISEEQVAGLLRGLTQDLLTLQAIRENDDIRQLISDAFRKRSGLLLESGTPIDVAAEAGADDGEGSSRG